MKSLIASRHFDGERYHQDPATLLIDGTRIVDVLPGEHAIGESLGRHVFVMPGLVEAHCHMFLDGADTDAARRAAYLEAPREQMMETARRNVERSLRHGVTLVRDAGDRYGINHGIRAESKLCTVRSAGIALRRPRRYGAFMAREIANMDELRAAVREAAASVDDLKIIETGIIDFEAGLVKGEPQFDAEALGLIVELARAEGIRTFAHCSGTAGIEIAVDAGVDSIEHGFFITRSILRKMADRGTAWVPTFSPVDFQWRRPEVAGWSAQTVGKLRGILDAHREHVALAAEMGVQLVAGSDAGSPGVDHGRGLIDEVFQFLTCGLTPQQALHAAGSRARRLWGAESADVRPGNRVDLVTLAGDPVADSRALLQVTGTVRGLTEAKGTLFTATRPDSSS